jgi:hypothetical protein
VLPHGGLLRQTLNVVMRNPAALAVRLYVDRIADTDKLPLLAEARC